MRDMSDPEMDEPLAQWELEVLEKQSDEEKAAEGQRLVRRRRLGPMPARFEELAVYNAERARGLMHTAECDSAMVLLQCEFNEWAGLV
jgi:hypothetical protein